MNPLRFVPLLKRLRWGGRRLGTVLGKPIGPEQDYAESWEVCDHGSDQSLVADGPHAGLALAQLVQEHGKEIFGRQAGLSQFPLLLKFLDASDRLSVQVHPNDEQARLFDPAERGKTEAWVILAADPGSVVYAGLQPGITRQRLADAIMRGAVEECLHRVPVAPGDCLFIPAGTVHAIGEGILLAEVQQSSDLTFRLFDWNRLGVDGKPRALHPEESLACVDFDRGPVTPVTPEVIASNAGNRTEMLVSCPYFRMTRRVLECAVDLPAEDRCRILMLLDAEVECRDVEGLELIRTGETLLLPADSKSQVLIPRKPTQLLEICWD